MEFLSLLPFVILQGDQETPVAVFRKANADDDSGCELKGDKDDPCDRNDLYFGSDDAEPKFCGKHFFSRAVSGMGDGRKLVYRPVPEDEDHLMPMQHGPDSPDAIIIG